MKMGEKIFRYLLVVDFESTCWGGRVNHNNKWEIIEFPAVLLNLETGEIERAFQKYVLPTENPKLSDFCTRLTGITQEQVDRGVPLPQCLIMFTEWVKNILREMNLTFPRCDPENLHGTIALATWSNWDFGMCLKQECSRKRLIRPSYFNQWIDLRHIYEEMYEYPPRSFLDALDYVDMQFVGRPHCGLDDSRNTAKLAAFMHKYGVNFQITTNLLPPGRMNHAF